MAKPLKILLSVVVVFVAMLVSAAITEMLFGELRPAAANIGTMILSAPFLWLIWRKREGNSKASGATRTKEESRYDWQISMTAQKKLILAGLAVASLFAIIAWWNRYEITHFNGQIFAKHDHWTGRTYLCDAANCVLPAPQ